MQTIPIPVTQVRSEPEDEAMSHQIMIASPKISLPPQTLKVTKAKPKQRKETPPALDGMKIVRTATSPCAGTNQRQHTACETNKDTSSTRTVESSAGTSNAPGAAQANSTVTNAQAVVTQSMARKTALTANPLEE
ncbi:hypothetical protein M404DRAFT_26417 [Pisolithus tinctorius Marx 270]|uniref:Uncharacterized protein n=1 Tax=Pisolithus tinctorius Marx 270 TaxID=870435 RepID=A0A0C3K3T4_PISTI|nr:hypothetical protein M404DRAFT_26417 [Pisolithus tinctorius Marx 270]